MQPDAGDQVLLEVGGRRCREQGLQLGQAGAVVRRPKPEQRRSGKVYRQEEAGRLYAPEDGRPAPAFPEVEQQRDVVVAGAVTDQTRETVAA